MEKVGLQNQFRTRILLPTLVIAFGFLLRFYDIQMIPPGLWYDEAIHGLDTLQIYEQHQFPIFFNTENHPQEPMFSYIIAIFYWLFGISPVVLRLTSVILGTITLGLCYFLCRRWFDERIALLTTFFLAISKWHLMFSRLCFRTILTPLFCILVFGSLYRALKDKKQQPYFYILCGIFLGLGLYTYISFRLVPVMVLLYILHEWYYSKDKKILLNSVYLFVAGFLTFLPLLIDYIHNPFHFFGRTDEITVFQNGTFSGVQNIFWNGVKTVGMFSIVGDPEIKHNNPGERMLPLILSILLIIGLVKAFKNWKELKYLIPLSWFIFFLLPSIFSMGAPNTLRTLGGVPALCILIAFGFVVSYDALIQFAGARYKLVLNVLFGCILLYSTGMVIYQYFYKWGRSPETAMHFNYNEANLGKQVAKLSTGYEVYLPDVLANQPVIKFVSHPTQYHSYMSVEDLPKPESVAKPMVIIYLNPERFANLDKDFFVKVNQRYHRGEMFNGLQIPGETPWVVAMYIPKEKL